MKKLLIKFFNSKLWFHVYYKHTSEFKNAAYNTKKEVYEARKRIIGR